jgi:hypothetical protein
VERQESQRKTGVRAPNPVKRGLVKKPGDWKWSSFWFYEKGEGGLVAIDPLD